ncbi:MAG: hypothetical protein V4640_09985 [Verrucomicrobiota bacterium]
MKTRLPPKLGFSLRIVGFHLVVACVARGAIDVTITTNPTSGGTFAAGSWTPTASPSRINVNDLITALNVGNVTINTTGALAEAGNITVATTVPLDNLTTAAARALTLNAQGSVLINAAFSQSVAGGDNVPNLVHLVCNGASLSMPAGVATSGGNFTATLSGAFNLGSSLITGGGAVSLSGSSGAISSVIITSGGNISVAASTALTLSSTLNALGGAGVADVTVALIGAGALTLPAASQIHGGASGDVNVTTFNGKLTVAGLIAGGTTRVEALNGVQDLEIQNTSSITASSGRATLRAGNHVTVSGPVSANTDLLIVADANGGGVGDATCAAALTAQAPGIFISGFNTLHTAGEINANSGAVEFTAVTATSMSGGSVTGAEGGLLHSGTSVAKTSGTIMTNGGNARFSAPSGTVTVSGGAVETGGGTVTVEAATYSLSAPFTTSGATFTASATGVNPNALSSEVLSSGGDISVSALSTLNFTGKLNATGGAGTGDVTLGLTGTGALTLPAGSEIRGGASGDANVTTLNGKLTVAGLIRSGTVHVESLGGLHDLEIQGTGSVTATLARVVLRGGNHVTVSGPISANTDLLIAADTNAGGVGDATCAAALTANAPGIFVSGVNTLHTAGTINANAGSLQFTALTATSMSGGSVSTASGGLLHSSPSVTMSAGIINTNGGNAHFRALSGTVTISGGSVATQGGTATIEAVIFSLSAPFATSGGTFTASATGAPSNTLSSEILSTGGDISVSSVSALNFTGKLNATGGAGAGDVTLALTGTGALTLPPGSEIRGGASGDANVTTLNGKLTVAGLITSGTARVEALNGTQDLEIQGTGSITASSGRATLRGGNHVTVSGPISANTDLLIAADTNGGGVGNATCAAALTAHAPGIFISGVNALHTAGVINTSGSKLQIDALLNVSLSGGSVVTGGGAIELLADNNVAINAPLNTTGTITLHADADLNLAGALTVASSVIGTTGNVILRGQGVAVNNVIDTTTGTIRVQPNAASVATIAAALTGPTQLVSGTTRFTTGSVTANALTVATAAILDFDTAARVVSPSAFSQHDLTGETRLRIGGTGAGQFNRIAVSGALTAGGKLTVALEAGFVPALGQTFDLFDFASFSGSFATLNFPPLAAGLAWDPTQLSVNGTLRILKPIEAWRQKHFGSTADSGPGASLNDFDFDGIVNLLEYALGLDPKQPSTAGQPVLAKTNVGGFDYLTLTLTRPLAVTDLDYRFLIGNTLPPSGEGSLYSPAGDVPSNGFTTQVSRSVVGENEVIVVRDNVLFGILPQRFMQLKITQFP